MIKKFLAIFTVALAFVSCQKTGVDLFKGNYSFKTSGNISLQEINGANPRTVAIPTESGQMDITTVDAPAGKMLVTMNVTGGEMIVFYAKADGDVITLEPKHRVVSYSHGDYSFDFGDIDAVTIEADYVVSGTGHRYDNIVLFDLKYSGTYTSGDTIYNIIGSDVACRAKLNVK